jgi:hypothetical protein
MSLWRCQRCGVIYAPDPGLCALCQTPTTFLQFPSFTMQNATVKGYLVPQLPYKGPDRRRPRRSWFDYLKLALALFGLAALVGGHIDTLIAHVSARELLSVGGGISAIVCALLTDPRIFSQIRSIQSVLDPEDTSREEDS